MSRVREKYRKQKQVTDGMSERLCNKTFTLRFMFIRFLNFKMSNRSLNFQFCVQQIPKLQYLL